MNYGAITQYQVGSSALVIGADGALADGLRRRGVQVQPCAGAEALRRPSGQYGTVYLVDQLETESHARDLLSVAARMASYRLVLVIPADDAARTPQRWRRINVTQAYELAREHGPLRGMVNAGSGMQALCIDRGAA